jgi:hypothetical protein
MGIQIIMLVLVVQRGLGTQDVLAVGCCVEEQWRNESSNQGSGVGIRFGHTSTPSHARLSSARTPSVNIPQCGGEALATNKRKLCIRT